MKIVYKYHFSYIEIQSRVDLGSIDISIHARKNRTLLAASGVSGFVSMGDIVGRLNKMIIVPRG